MILMWENLKYIKNKMILKRIMIQKYGRKEGLHYYRAILRFHKNKQKLKNNGLLDDYD